MLWNNKNSYFLKEYDSEKDLENSIQEVKESLFGENRIYIEFKRRIGAKGKKQNIPDGYLIDLSDSKNPKLFIVEVELSSHHPTKHIAVQMLEFCLAFEEDKHKVKKVLSEEIKKDKILLSRLETFAKRNNFDNIDRLIEIIVYDSQFKSLVIIDELVDNLDTILMNKLNFSVEILTLKRYSDSNNNFLYDFVPFLQDVECIENNSSKKPIMLASEVDTIIVPAQEEGFNTVFLGENRWWSIRISPTMIDNIKYIASYQTAPFSAITHIAEVESIRIWENTNKYVVNFKSRATKIKEITLVANGKIKAPQAPRYANYEKLLKAKNMDNIWI